MTQAFQLTREDCLCPLLLEASAGTGKTYSIQYLVLRLLLECRGSERPFEANELLLMTFTRAATAELKSRVRNIIQSVSKEVGRLLRNEEDMSGIPLFEDAQFQALYNEWALAPEKILMTPELDAFHAEPERFQTLLLKTIQARLSQALTEFDDMTVSTLHSFCKEVLTQQAFRANQSFDMTLVDDDSPYALAVIEDFMRRVLPTLSETTQHNLLAIEMHEWRNLLSKIIEVPNEKTSKYALTDFEVNTELGCLDLTMLHDDAFCMGYQEAFDEFYKDPTNDEKKAAYDVFRQDLRVATVYDELHTFGEKFAKEVPDALIAAKAADHVLTFNDLIVNLYEAIYNPTTGQGLINQVRETYKAVLIDEFQDTDPVQYAIFKAIFLEGAVPGTDSTGVANTHRTLIFVGDPKQSIYKFRSADINTYFEAREQIEKEGALRVLDTNYRSTTAFVDAINTFFTWSPRPFLTDQLTYDPVKAPANNKRLGAFIRQDEGFVPLDPLSFWAHDENDMPYASIPTQVMDKWVAQDIHGLLEAGQKSLDERGAVRMVTSVLTREAAAALREKGEEVIEVGPDQWASVRHLEPKDFAVLARQRAHFRDLESELNAKGIGVLKEGEASVLETEEAKDLLMVLRAIVNRADRGALQLYRATTFKGMTLGEIRAYSQVEHLSSEALQADIVMRRQLSEAFDTWEKYGIASALAGLMQHNNVERRLLGYPDGEQRLMNLTHLIEILHDKGQMLKYPNGLLAWYEEAIQNGLRDRDALGLRKGGDENRVALVTMHASKGLQYPFVYWIGAHTPPKARKERIWREQGDDGRMKTILAILETTLSPAAEKANWDELQRMTYVTMTRAESHMVVCHPLKGTKKGKYYKTNIQTSVCRCLSFQGDGYETPLEDDIRAYWTESNGGKGVPHTVNIHYGSDEPYRLSRTTPKPMGVKAAHTVYSQWGKRSYSSLAKSADDSPHTLVFRVKERPTYPEGSIKAFPRGPQAGTTLHAILELVNFKDAAQPPMDVEILKSDAKSKAIYKERQLNRLITRQLTYAGYEALTRVSNDLTSGPNKGFSDAPTVLGIREMLHTLSRAPLTHEGEALKDINVLVREMEFLLHLKTDKSARALAEMITAKDARYDVRLANDDSIQGFLKGFIDMVFVDSQGRWWVLDWKSNALDIDDKGYSQEGMREEIKKHHYDLQYLLYLTALRRHLLSRGLKNPQIGGAVYVFLRGVEENAAGEGIYVDQVESKMIEAIDEFFKGAH